MVDVIPLARMRSALILIVVTDLLTGGRSDVGRSTTA